MTFLISTIILVMTITRSIADAKTHLAECVTSAEAGDPVLITRHGKPVAAIVRAEDLAVIERSREDDPQAGLAGVIGREDDFEDFALILDEVVRRRGPPRPLPTLE